MLRTMEVPTGDVEEVTFYSTCFPVGAGSNNPGYVSASGPDSKTGLIAPVCVDLGPDGSLYLHYWANSPEHDEEKPNFHHPGCRKAA